MNRKSWCTWRDKGVGHQTTVGLPLPEASLRCGIACKLVQLRPGKTGGSIPRTSKHLDVLEIGIPGVALLHIEVKIGSEHDEPTRVCRQTHDAAHMIEGRTGHNIAEKQVVALTDSRH